MTATCVLILFRQGCSTLSLDKTVGRGNLHKHPQRLRPLVLAVYKTKSFCSYCSNITKMCSKSLVQASVQNDIQSNTESSKWFSRLISEIYGLKLNRGIVQFLNGAHSNIWLCESAFVMRMKQFRRVADWTWATLSSCKVSDNLLSTSCMMTVTEKRLWLKAG